MVTIIKRIVVLSFVAALVDSAQAAPAYPVKVSSANSRLLVDQNNIPFLLVGDSPHSLIVNLNVADAAMFFRDRATNEFNSLWIELLCEDSEAGRADGSLLDGTTPFTNTLAGGDWDFTTPNEAYFAHVDQIVRMAETNGLQIMLNPLDTGGWLEIALANGPARCRQYGQYVGNRYKDFPNILWLNGNDFLTWSTPADEAVVTAIALGIKDHDTNHIQTVEFDYPVSSSTDDPNWAPIISLNGAYTYYPTYAEVLAAYQKTNRMPVFMVEGHYEFQNFWSDLGTPLVLRRQEYWSLLSGAIGHVYGNGNTWLFQPGWNSPTNLNSIAITQMRYATALFKSREWHGFVPDIAHTVLTAGLGTYATSGTISGNNYATCARETNGHTVMVYAPTQRTMTINMTKVSGTNALAWWFNPLTGTATNFGAYATTGTRTFIPPNNNDWVLVLDDAAQNFPAPGAASLIPALQITINSLPSAQNGVVYPAQLTAAGGTTPYNWDLAPASKPLPDGLILSQSGMLSGTPATSGTFDFTVRVTDAAATNVEQTLTLTVNGPNTPPTISGLADQTINEDTATGPLSFSIGDEETAAGSLTLSKGSSDPVLVPASNIVFGGTGSNKTVTITPTTHQTGTATISIDVSDGQLTATTNFLVTVNAVNDAPTITGVTNQTIGVNGTTGPLNFTIGDAETATDTLTLSGDSSNLALVPASSIVFGGGDSNRTVTVTPVPGQSGTTTITISVSDGQLSANDAFELTVIAPNVPPTISGIEDQTTNEDTDTGLLSFTVGDTETAAGSLTLGKGSSNPSLVPTNNIEFGGSGNNRTVVVTPATNQNGTATITIIVSDGQDLASTNFVLTVNAVNDAPTISTIANQTVNASGTAGPLNFTIEDVETAAGGLILSGDSSDLTLVPPSNIVFGGSSSNRTVTVTPATGQTGSATITISVSDGALSASNSFVLAVNNPPTISGIGDQVINEDTTTGPVSFTVGDAETAPESLTLDKASSNAALVPTNNILFGGSASNRTVTVTPAAGQSGTTTITVNVSDGALSASNSFVLTVNAGNTPPTISSISNLTFNEDTAAAPLNFTVGDAETPAEGLTLGRASSNAALLPTNNIVFGGSGSNRTVTVTPATNQNGTATITATVSDGQSSSSMNFLVTVNAVNDAPTITGISNKTIIINGTTGPLSFTIGDVETAAGSLTLNRSSSNTTLVPTNNIVFGGSGSNRTVIVTPATNQIGSATIAVSVKDGALSASKSFVLTVTPAPGTKSFTNAAAITIPDSGSASPYPSTISVSGLGGVISNVTMSLRGLTHTWKADIDMLLVSPGGQKVLVMSDAGAIYTESGSLTITLADSASAFLPASSALATGTFKPTGYPPADSFPSPAPAGPYGTNMAKFNGQSANGTWSLYVFDDGSDDNGSIATGWSLTVTTVTPPPPSSVSSQVPPQIISTSFDSQGAMQITVSGEVGLSYAFEASSDYVNWTQVDVQDNTTGTMIFREPMTTNKLRFFRAVSVP